MIEIKCSKKEKAAIINSIESAYECPFSAGCSELNSGKTPATCRNCLNCNIKWTITDEQKPNMDEQKLNMDERRPFSRHDVIHAGALAATEMVDKNPAIMLICDELSRVIAGTTKYLFDKEG